jgi:hypothetical protein
MKKKMMMKVVGGVGRSQEGPSFFQQLEEVCWIQKCRGRCDFRVEIRMDGWMDGLVCIIYIVCIQKKSQIRSYLLKKPQRIRQMEE